MPDSFSGIRTSPQWDDTILQSSFYGKLLKGRRKYMHAKEFAQGWGDYETLCRACQAAQLLMKPDALEDLAKVVVALDNICVLASPFSGRRQILNAGTGIVTLYGFDCVGLVAWCLACWVRGCDSMDCKSLYSDSSGAMRVIAVVFMTLDELQNTRYNISDLRKEFEQAEQERW